MAKAEVGTLEWARQDYWQRARRGELHCETAPPGTWEAIAQVLQERRPRSLGDRLVEKTSTRTLTLVRNIADKGAWILGILGAIEIALTVSHILPIEDRFNPLVGSWHAIAGFALVLTADQLSKIDRRIRTELSHRQ